MKHENGNPATTAEVSAVGAKVDDLRRAFEGVFAKSPPENDWKTESDLHRLQTDLDWARSDLRRFEEWCGFLDAPLRRRARNIGEEIAGLQFEIATLRPELTVRAALLREKHSAWKERIAGVGKRIEGARKEISDLVKAKTERERVRFNWVLGLFWGAVAMGVVTAIVAAAARN